MDSREQPLPHTGAIITDVCDHNNNYGGGIKF